MVADLKTLLDAGWTSANTNSRTPTISNINDVKRIDIGAADIILLKYLTAVSSDNASGGLIKEETTVIKVDIRTSFSRDQMAKIKNEVKRIINANRTNPFSGSPFVDVVDPTTEEDLSHTLVKCWRYTINIEFQQFTKAI